MSEYSQWDIERIEQAAYRSGVNNAGREWAREVSTLQALIAELEAENAALQARAEKAESMVERLIEASGNGYMFLQLMNEWDDYFAKWKEREE